MAEKFDPVAWAKDLGKSTIKGGEVQKALTEAAVGLGNLKKEGDSEGYLKALDKLLKAAIPNEKKKAPKEAQKDLDDLKHAVELERKSAEVMLFSVAKEDKGTPA